MTDPATTEDERGVDVAQIRAQLALSIPERVRTMVDAANRMMAMQNSARAARPEQAG